VVGQLFCAYPLETIHPNLRADSPPHCLMSKATAKREVRTTPEKIVALGGQAPPAVTGSYEPGTPPALAHHQVLRGVTFIIVSVPVSDSGIGLDIHILHEQHPACRIWCTERDGAEG